MSRTLRSILATVAAGALASGGVVLTAPAAVAITKPESVTILNTAVLPVTSSTGQQLVLTLTAERHSNRVSKPDRNSKGTVTATLSKGGDAESHAWTFPLAKASFTSTGTGDGQLKTGHQLAPYGFIKLTMSPLKKGVRRSCGGGDYEVHHKVALTGSLKLKTHSGGDNSWGVVSLDAASLKGTLYGGHGPDNEEACGGFPPCMHGISWLASKGNLTLSGERVAATGQTAVGIIRGDRYTDLGTPTGAFRIDEVVATASEQSLAITGGSKTLSVVADAAQPAAGDAALTATHKNDYANGCAGGQETGHLWNAKYTTADLPLTFTEDVFGPMSIASTKSATFEKFHVA